MIQLHEERRLDMRLATQPGRPRSVAAASGLVRVGEWDYVIADDENALAVFSAASGRESVGESVGESLGEWFPLFDRADELPLEAEARKRKKADFEVICLLPRGVCASEACLCVLPSGSMANRHRGVLLPLRDDGLSFGAITGALTGTRHEIQTSTLYLYVARAINSAARKPGLVSIPKELQRLNIEGVCWLGDALWLFNRGNDTPAVNAVAVLDGARALRLMRGENLAEELLVRHIYLPDLGARDGVPYSFTDACALADGRIVFSACAEDTQDSYSDGVCIGSCLGIIDQEGKILVQRDIMGSYKVEGLSAWVVENGHSSEIHFRAVQDADGADAVSAIWNGKL